MFYGIELARGVAALMVLLSHYAHWLTDGPTLLNFFWTGVDLFFVISGFVFARLLLSGQVSPMPFFIRRFFRLYPLYCLAVLTYWWLWPTPPQGISLLFDHLAMLHTTHSRAEAFYLNPAFWSLPVEVEFYLLIPWLTWLFRWRHALWLTALVSLLLRGVIMLQSPPESESLWFFLSVHITGILPEFLIGVGLYPLVQALVRAPQRIKRRYTGLSMVGGLLLLGGLADFFVTQGDAGFAQHPLLRAYFGVLCALGYALVLAPLILITPSSSTDARHHPSSRPTQGPPWGYRISLLLGSLSYSIYLMHNATPVMLQKLWPSLSGPTLALSALVLTLVLAGLMHRLIEEPARLWGRHLSRRWHARRPISPEDI